MSPLARSRGTAALVTLLGLLADFLLPSSPGSWVPIQFAGIGFFLGLGIGPVALIILTPGTARPWSEKAGSLSPLPHGQTRVPAT